MANFASLYLVVEYCYYMKDKLLYGTYPCIKVLLSKYRIRKYKNITDVVLHVIYMTAAAVNEKLVQFLNEGKPWEKKATSIPGVFLFKLPTFKGTSSSLAIEINPVSSSTGAVTK